MVKHFGTLLVSLAGLCAVATAMASRGVPFPAAAPEIDPASVVSALTLLGGSLMVMRGRSRK